MIQILGHSWSTEMIVIFDLLFGPHQAGFPAGAQDFKMAAQRLTAGVEKELILYKNTFIED